jgi:hypothetical protein
VRAAGCEVQALFRRHGFDAVAEIGEITASNGTAQMVEDAR